MSVRIPLKQIKQSGAFNHDVIRYNDGYGVWESSVEMVPTTTDKNLTPWPTVGNGSATGAVISDTPLNAQYVTVLINGIAYSVGDGSKLLDCYFSGDGGATARNFANIVMGDMLFWNGIIAGFNLGAVDRVDLLYSA